MITDICFRHHIFIDQGAINTMFNAINENGNIINIENASLKDAYFCPYCKGHLHIKASHYGFYYFAHDENLICKHNESEWKLNIKSYCPASYTNITVKTKTDSQMADILINKTVILLGENNFSSDDFTMKTKFFLKNGFKICWILDVRENIKCFDKNISNDKRKLEYLNIDDFNSFLWKNPIVLDYFFKEPKIDDNSNLSIFLDLYDGDDDLSYNIYKIINTDIISDDGNLFQYDFSKFNTNIIGINLNDPNFSLDDLFLSKAKIDEKHIKSQLQALQILLDKTNGSYIIRYIGEKGKGKELYTCPKNNVFGIKKLGTDGCGNCNYCSFIVTEPLDDEYEKNSVICAYPTLVRDIQSSDIEENEINVLEIKI